PDFDRLLPSFGPPLLHGIPLPCVSGVTVADVKKPSRAILAGTIASDKPGVLRAAGSGRLDLGGITVKMLLRQAYRISGYRIYAGPSWLDSIVEMAPDYRRWRT